MDRHIDFEGIENFRDFGGYATACGRGLARGKLYRSGHHSAATDADLARLKALGIAAIVDLRHPKEREREPSRRWDACEARVICNDIASERPDWVEKLHDKPLTADWFYEDGLDFYRDGAFEPRHVDMFRRFLHAAGESEGAVVVHCAAGKDRTGIACALLHHVAGVHRDDLMADYLLTNDESRIERKIAQVGPWLETNVGRRPSDEALRVAVSVFPAYLETTFAAMEARCGSVDGYLEQVLGVDAALRERVHARVIGQ
jgi:protein tyrosine/serine phosphatase